MAQNILDYLDTTLTWLPEKTALRDGSAALSFRQLHQRAMAVGTWLYRRGMTGKSVGICMGRGAHTLTAYLGCVYAGCSFLPLEADAAIARTVRQTGLGCILIGEHTGPLPAQVHALCQPYSLAQQERVDAAALAAIRAESIDADPVCILPTRDKKYAVLSHRALLENTEHLGTVLHCSSNTVFGSVAPPADGVSLLELLCTLKYGACCCLLPESEPVGRLLTQYRVDTLCWPDTQLSRLPSRPCSTLAVYGTQTTRLPMAALRLFGLAETGGICCWQAPGDEGFQMFPNSRSLILDETDRESDWGELCIRGSCLALGHLENGTIVPFPDNLFRTGLWAHRSGKTTFCLDTRAPQAKRYAVPHSL